MASYWCSTAGAGSGVGFKGFESSLPLEQGTVLLFKAGFHNFSHPKSISGLGDLDVVRYHQPPGSIGIRFGRVKFRLVRIRFRLHLVGIRL